MSEYRHVSGLKDLEAALVRLGAVYAKRVLDAEAKAALEPVAAMAKTLARRTPTDVSRDLGDPHLADRIVVRVAKPRAGCLSSAVVTIKKGGKEVKPIAQANRLMRKVLKGAGFHKAESQRIRRKLGLFAKNPRRTWHLVEWGFRHPKSKKMTRAFPFIRPAADARLEAGLATYRDNMKKRIERAARRVR